MKSLYHLILMLCILQMPFIGATAQVLPDSTIVAVLAANDTRPIPKDAELKGSIKIGDGGLKLNCGYTQTIQTAKEKAREKGANLVKITVLKKPDAWSSCYRLQADVYYYPYAAELRNYKDDVADSIANALIPDTASYALLFAYRPRGGVGPIVHYDLHVDDSEVGNMKPGVAYLIKLYKPGRTKLWARTESEVHVNIDVAPRKVYFLRSTIRMGVMVGRPELELINSKAGLREFSAIEEWREGKRKKKGNKAETNED